MVFLYNNRTVKPCRKGFDKIQQQLMIKTLERKKVYWDISQHEKGNIQEVHRLYENNNPTKQEFPPNSTSARYFSSSAPTSEGYMPLC